MAIENNDLKEQMEKLRADLQGLGSEAEDDATGLKAFSAATISGIVGTAAGLGSFAKTVGNGDTSFKSLDTVVDAAAGALAGMASAVPYAGKIAAAAIVATAEASKFMLKQMDETAKAFNDISKVGALTADGMSGIQRQFTQSGLPLNAFTKIVSENSVTLARWQGTAGAGAEDFSKVVHEFTQGADDSLRQLGQNAEQIGQTTAAYLTQQTRLGQSQGQTTAQLIEGTKKYGTELDLLQKITGMSATSIQKQQDKMLSDARFRANIDEMVQSGNAGLAKGLQDFQTRMSGYGEQIGKGTADLASGAANTKDAAALMNSTGGAALDIIQRLKSGSITQAEANDEMISAMERNQQSQRDNAKYVDEASSNYIKYSEISDAVNAKQKGVDSLAKKTQTKQLSAQDKLTNTTVEAQKAIEAMNINIQQMGFAMMKNAVPAVRAVTESIADLLDWVNEKLGIDDGSYEEVDVPVTDQVGNPTGYYGKERRKLTKEERAAKKEKEKVNRKAAREQEDYDYTAEIEASDKAAPIPKETSKAGKPGASAADASAPSATAPAGSESGEVTPSATDVSAGKEQVDKEGLKVRPSGDVFNGGPLTATALDVAKQIQNSVEGFQYYTGLNDKYHKEKRPNSQHALGRGLDFVMASKPTPEQAKEIQKQLQALSGVSYVKNEFYPPPYGEMDSGTTGPHMHVQTSAAQGAVLTGPQGGYSPNKSMSGVDVKPLAPENVNTVGKEITAELVNLQLTQLDGLISSARSQLAVKERLLKSKY